MKAQKEKFLDKKIVRELITLAYESLLLSLCRNRYDDEETEHTSPVQTAENKRDTLREILKLNLRIVDDIAKRFLNDQKQIKLFHPRIKGIDNYKQAGYLTFWISNLKPIMIVDDVPDSFEIKIETIMFINEYLAIKIASGILYSKFNADPPFNQKIIDDLIFSLRYRINTRHGLILMYESLCCYFDK